jgi:hypothetical protein
MAKKKKKAKKAKKAKKVTKKKVAAKKELDVEAKAKQIQESKMPDEQKEKYLRDIGYVASEDGSNKNVDGHKIPLKVYFVIKKIPKNLQDAMKVYPKAKGLASATKVQWDEIFKKF